MKIGATVSEFHRNVVQIIKSREDNDSQNKEVNNLSLIQRHWINSDPHQGSGHVLGPRRPGDSSSLI